MSRLPWQVPYLAALATTVAMAPAAKADNVPLVVALVVQATLFVAAAVRLRWEQRSR